MRAAGVLAWMVVVAVPCAAQTNPAHLRHYRPTEVWRDTVPEPRWYRAYPGEAYRAAWEYAKKCSGWPEQKGGRYEDIIWLIVSTGGLRNEGGDPVLGVYLYPDTIAIDSMWMEAAWVIIHEELHHLRHIKNDDSPHPAYPFAQPCMVTYQQNIPPQLGPQITVPARITGLKFIGKAKRGRIQ